MRKYLPRNRDDARKAMHRQAIQEVRKLRFSGNDEETSDNHPDRSYDFPIGMRVKPFANVAKRDEQNNQNHEQNNCDCDDSRIHHVSRMSLA
ncbi:hypothetical protein [Burkholderia sp. WAC0059]|uniref:hypothetical protein n=1 Tax=Burkholderia sp. WAC0059 TaxID=2066022 RepID=UPI0011AED8A2|nr:hypothetical protein [Burkholderia sp. WAC0059]